MYDFVTLFLSLSLFISSSTLGRHLTEKKSVCEKRTKTMNSSEDFIYGPNDYGELNGSCQRCHVHYGSAAELKLHFATIHQRQTFECFVCNKLFLQKFNFLAHIDRVHPDLGKNFSCQYCDRVSN